MGTAVSILQDQSPEKQFEIFKKLRQVYESEYISFMNGSQLKSQTEMEEFLVWKGKVESLLLAPIDTIPSKFVEDYENVALGISSKLERLNLGDIVKVRDGELMFEGMIVEIIGGRLVRVDFGDDVEEFPIDKCSLVLRAIDYEIDDHVQIKPEGSALYFTGRVITINIDGTINVRMDGDDADDIEYNIPIENCIKIKSCRPQAIGLWKKLRDSLKAAHIFNEIRHERVARSFSVAATDKDPSKDFQAIRRLQTQDSYR